MYFPFLCLSILLASVASEPESLVKVGDLKNYAHGISGEVFVKDEKTLVIKGKVCKIVNKDCFIKNLTKPSSNAFIKFFNETVFQGVH
jgi:hypothetical protein